jgi:hypothetical protein
MMPVAERWRSFLHIRKLASPRKRWDYGLAERIASKTFNRDTNPDRWELIVKRGLEAIPEFFDEYGARP